MRHRGGAPRRLRPAAFRPGLTWGIDLTSVARSELVGLGPDLNDAVTEVLMTWLAAGPPREGIRTVMDIPFYEVPVADDYLLAYSVDDERRRVAILWVRARPGMR